MTPTRILRVGFQWNCPWRLEWMHRFEYWYRSQCGPFYVLHVRREP